MQRGDVGGSSYDPQYYPPHFQNPNLISAPTDPQYAHATAPYASAPPVSPGYASSDYSSYPSNYPPYQQNSDHVPTQPPPYSNTFPHLETQQPAAYYTYDQNQNQNQNQTGLSYDYSAAAGANYNPPNPDYNSASFSSAPYLSSSYGSSGGPNFGNSVDNNVNYGGYGDQGLYGSGVYKYNGAKADTYGGGSGGSRSEPSSEVLFDDYGRPINVPGGKEQKGSGSFPKIVKAVPKVEEHEDPKSGVLKFRVKLLSESYGQSDMDVLCQIGLDGIRILEPATSRTLKIYPLDTVARWEVLDAYIFAFWTNSSVDVEPKRIRLKSNSYTTNNILDAVTAASIQVKEMGESSRASDLSKAGSEQLADKRKGIADWMRIVRPQNEEKDHWVPDEAVTKCTHCRCDFNAFVRRHHCRNCGDIFCDKCTQGRIALTADESAQPVRVCDQCMAEVTQRLSNAKEATLRVGGLQSHEDLARKLKEEMSKNRKTPAKSLEGSGRMREVACPICTVHLQVQVPASGSETIECSVCQHPFLVSAH